MKSSSKRNVVGILAAAAASVLAGQTASAQVTGNWIGPSGGLWSASGNWQDGIIPNGQGHTAQYTTGASNITVNDVVGGVTVGTLRVMGTLNSSWQITPNENVFLNQDGAGPLRASVINDIQTATPGSNPAIFLNVGSAGTFVLQDDLFISNTSTSVRTSGSVQIRGSIRGAGNITIENISNNIGAGQVAFTNNESSGLGAGGWAGNTTVAKGAVTFTRGDVFTPSPGNFVTIGAAGKGDATLAAVGGGLGNIENNFVVAANTGGTSLFVANSSNANNIQIKSTNTNAAFITLNGDLTFENRATNGSIFIIGDPMQGVGQINKAGPGAMEITHTSTHSGGTVVKEGILKVRHADAFNNGFGFYAATDGTLGSGDVTVLSTATQLEIDTLLAGIDVIANSAALNLAATGGNGKLVLGGAGVSEVVGGLVINGVTQTVSGTYGSSASAASFQDDNAFSGPGVITLALGRILYWDIDGAAAGAGGATPTGNWNGTALSFNTDVAGAGGGTLSRTTLSTDPVVFTAGADGTGTYTVNVSGTQSAASVSIARGAVTLTGGTIATPTFDVATGASGTVESVLTGGTANSLTKTGAGTLILTAANTYTGTTTVNGGTLQVNNAASAPLLTGAGGTDIKSGRVVFDYTGGTAPNVRPLLVASYNGGVNAFQSGQIRSSTATATRVLGYRDDGVSQVTVMYTVNGDANLSGTVSIADVNIAKANFGGNNDVWATGDFNYDGNTSIADINTTKARFGDALPLMADGGSSSAGRSASLEAGSNAAPDKVELVVNVVTGQVRLVGNDTDVAEITSYEVGSATGSLNLAGYTSLASQGRPGWGALPGTAQLVGEDHGFTSDTVNLAGLSLGNLFTVGAPQNLIFNYGDENFATLNGTVSYVPEPVSALFPFAALLLVRRVRRTRQL